MAIKECGVAREKLFVTTKLHPQTTDDIRGAFDRSLKRLGLEYVDLYAEALSFEKKKKENNPYIGYEKDT